MNNSSIPPALRTAVFLRDKGICQICGQPVNINDYDADHIKQVAEGGETTLENLRCTHARCNRSRPKVQKPAQPEAQPTFNDEDAEFRWHVHNMTNDALQELHSFMVALKVLKNNGYGPGDPKWDALADAYGAEPTPAPRPSRATGPGAAAAAQE